MSASKISGEKVFGYYLDFPAEVRNVVIDEMQPDDRCRFTRCSKLCSKEVKYSKKFIFSLEFRDLAENYLRIGVVFGDCEEYNHKMHGFVLLFKDECGKKYIECKQRISSMTFKLEPLWRTELDNSIDLVQHAIERFKDLAQFYQNTIRKLLIDIQLHTRNGHFANFDFGLEKLGNLEELVINNDADISQFLPKIRRPLKCLAVIGEENNRIVAEWEPIFKVRKSLELPHLKLNSQQFRELSAKNFDIHIGELTEEDIFDFIKSWQDGTNSHCRYSWNLRGSNFDLQKLVELLGFPDHYLILVDLIIKHNKDENRRAILAGDPLSFEEY